MITLIIYGNGVNVIDMEYFGMNGGRFMVLLYNTSVLGFVCYIEVVGKTQLMT